MFITITKTNSLLALQLMPSCEADYTKVWCSHRELKCGME